MRSKEELTALKEEVETQNKKLHKLTDEELAQVSGGAYINEKNKGFDETYLYDYTYEYYKENNSDGILRNPGDKYFD